jgi:pimeloyl-ACP methyl ester carboxylesterase
MTRMEPTSGTVVANGLRHHVLAWDGGGPTTVLCLHGFLDVGWAFHAVAPALADAGFHVVAPDLRGHGETERVGAGGYYHFMDYVLDVADLVDALARDRLAIVGHSMGGAVAAYYAGTFPERVWRLALLESLRVPETAPASVPHRTAEWVAGVRRARAQAARVYPSLDAAAARIRELDPRCPPEEARAFATRGTVPVPGGVSFRHDPLHATRGPYPFRLDVARAFWSAVACPVLCVEGAESGSAGVDLAERHACFRQLREASIAGAGHMMMRHRPTEVAQLLLEFLAE